MIFLTIQVTREFSVAEGKPMRLTRYKTRFLAQLISQPEIPQGKLSLCMAIWREDDELLANEEVSLRSLVQEVRIDTGDTLITPDKFPVGKKYNSITFHRIQAVFGKGYVLRRVWDADEIAQGKNSLWTPGFSRI